MKTLSRFVAKFTSLIVAVPPASTESSCGRMQHRPHWDGGRVFDVLHHSNFMSG